LGAVIEPTLLTQEAVEENYLSFFFGRRSLLWPHFFLRQLCARG
jgi:hypothetical protein